MLREILYTIYLLKIVMCDTYKIIINAMENIFRKKCYLLAHITGIFGGKQ